MRGATVQAREFLNTQASETRFAETADAIFQQSSNAKVAILAVADSLSGWVEFVNQGLINERPFEVRARVEVAGDLMEQVERLLEDVETHVAAPISLAGAALEEFLRSMHFGCSEPIAGNPGIAAYASALRKAGLLTKQDEKDITSWAGQRNEAAHGRFDELSRERARLMADGINLFMRQHLTA